MSRFGTLAVLRTVLADKVMRRVLLGYAGFSIGEQASWLALMLYAYEQGGIAETGAVASGLLVPAALGAPFIAVLPDRIPRLGVLTVGFALTAALELAVAATMLGGSNRFIVYALSGLLNVSLVFGVPAVVSQIPRLANRSDQLVAANAGLGLVTTLGHLAGPALAGVILIFGDVGHVMVFAAASTIGASALTLGQRSRVSTHPDDATESVMDSFTGGIRQLTRRRHLRTLVGLMSLTSVMEGALDVGLVAIVVELLRRSEASVSMLATALGVGGLLGSLFSLYFVDGRKRLSRGVITSSLLTAAMIAATGHSNSLVLTMAALVLTGMGMMMTSVGCQTMLQGLSPDDTLARIFGVLEGLKMAGLAVGGLLIARLAVSFGLTAALTWSAVATAIIVAIRARELSRIDAARLPVDPLLLASLRSVPAFAALPPYVIEQLASNMETRHFEADEVVVRRGDPGDCLYVISGGQAVVRLSNGRVIERGIGTYIGEIALLQGSGRTADVQAGTDGLSTYVLAGDVFLEAITQVPRSLARAEAEMTRRLSDD